MKTRNLFFAAISILIFLLAVNAQTTEFTYQGRLINGGLPASVPHDFEFRLFATETGGSPIGGVVESRPGVQISNGVFSVRLNFGAEFDGSARWLEISVRQTGGSTFALLNPRQPLSSAPYSIKSLNSDISTTSTNATQLNGIPASQYVLTTDTRMTDARTPTAGSGDYIQNRTTEQTGTNFNVGGNGTVGGVFTTSSGSAAAPSITFTGDTGTGFFRSAPGTLRFSTGGVARMVVDPNGRIGLGTEVFPTPTRFFALEDNPSASSAYGIYGRANGTTGSRTGVFGISFFPDAQAAGTTGSGVLGSASGATQNYGVIGNAFGAGTFNAGVYGSASGATVNYAGFFSGNTFVGGAGIVRSYINSDSNAGLALTLNNQPGWSVATVSGGQFQIYNDAIGQNAFWIDNTNNNTGIGTLTPNARLDVAGSINTSTQFNIGGNRTLSANGAYNDGISANSPASNIFAGVGAGSNTAPDPSLSGFFGKMNSFFGAGAGQANTTGYLNSFFGFQAGAANTTATGNAFFGQSAGSRNTGASNSFFGRLAGSNNVGGNSNTAVGENADFAANNATGAANTLLGSNTRIAVNTNSQTALGSASRVDAANSTAIGFRAYAVQSNSLVLGSINGVNNCTPPFCDSVNVGIGTTAPTQRLHVVGNGLVAGDLTVTGTINGNFNGTIATANNALNLGGVAANQYVQTNDFRLTNQRDPLPNSGNYIQNNSGSPQPGSFNISGNGTIGGILSARVNAATNDSSTAIQAQNLNTASGQNFAISGRSVSGPPGFGTGGIFEGGAFGVRGTGSGDTTTASATGVFGLATGSAGSRNGVIGSSDASVGVIFGTGVFGTANGPAAVNYGVRGSASGGTTNWAGYFDGNVGLNGNSNNFALTFTNQANTAGRRGYRIAFDNDRLSFQKANDSGVFLENQVTIDQATGAVSIGRDAVGGDLTVYGNTLVNTMTVANGLTLNVLGSAGGIQLCRNLSNQISACSSSLRYKNNVEAFFPGLTLVKRLRPVTFNWKGDGKADMGLVAEEVAEVEPLLATYNDEGEVEGVKYDRIGVVAVNAIKEQQEQIERQQRLIEGQEKTNADLRKEVFEMREKLKMIQAEGQEMKKALCALHPELAPCKEEK